MIDEVIECVFEAARKQLPLQIYGKETRAGCRCVCNAPCGRCHHVFNDAMLMQAGG